LGRVVYAVNRQRGVGDLDRRSGSCRIEDNFGEVFLQGASASIMICLKKCIEYMEKKLGYSPQQAEAARRAKEAEERLKKMQKCKLIFHDSSLLPSVSGKKNPNGVNVNSAVLRG
jgi:hypothetical protein